MAINTIVLSPEYVSCGRREALNATADQGTGTFVSLNSDGKFEATAAAAGREYISKENISTAQGIAYLYAADELMFAAALPNGCRVAVAAGEATEYEIGSLVEIGANGRVIKQAAGVAVGVVVETITPAAVGDHIAIDLL